MSERFYADFEKEFRGSRHLIKERLKVYLPIISSLAQYCNQCTVVDLGCGRGEWLELLRDCGHNVFGVDIDDAMLSSCRELGLNVELNDAISCLRAFADASINIVSLFHLAEHLVFADLKTVVLEAYRVLAPGGLLILETPNPENLRVASESFYTDPTHIRPIPPALLQFILRHQGFADSHILRLNSHLKLKEHSKVTLLDVLTHVSPDYAVVGVKDGPPELLQAIHENLIQIEGITLEMLARRFETDQELEFARLSERLVSLAVDTKINKLESSQSNTVTMEEVLDVKRLSEDTHSQLIDLKALHQQDLVVIKQNQEKLADLQVKVDATHQALQSIYTSTSWRVTWPLRWVGDHVFIPLGIKRGASAGSIITKTKLKSLYRRTVPRQSRFDYFIAKLLRHLRRARYDKAKYFSHKEVSDYSDRLASYTPDQYAKPLDAQVIMSRIRQRIK